LGCGQEPSSQPPSGPTPSVPGVGASGSRPEARGRPEKSPDPSAGGAEVAPEGQVRASAPQGPPLVPAAHGVSLKSSRPRPGNLLPGRPKQERRQSCRRSGPRRLFREPGSKKPPPGAVDHGPKWVSISECLRLGFPFICLGRDFPSFFYPASEAMARPTWHPGRPLRRRRTARPAPPRALSFSRPFRRAFHRRGLGRRLSLGSGFPRLALLPRRPS
jgi:hypothetical protein